MSENDKITDDSKTELTDEQLDGAQGGAAFLKLGDIDGESRLKMAKVGTSLKVNKAEDLLDKSSTKLKM